MRSAVPMSLSSSPHGGSRDACLIDTSAWIEYLRATGSAAHVEVRRLLLEEPDRVAVTEPVVMELLAGATSTSALGKLEMLTSGLRRLPLDPAVDFHSAASVFRAARSDGRTVRKLIDCLIASVALRTDTLLVHRDRDFDALAELLPDLRTTFLR